MKLKVEQLDRVQRDTLTQALVRVAEHNEMNGNAYSKDLRALARRIDHGEVLLCEWQYQTES